MVTPPEENNSNSSSASDKNAPEEDVAAESNLDSSEDSQAEISHVSTDSDSIAVPSDDDSMSPLGDDLDSGSMHSKAESSDYSNSNTIPNPAKNNDALNGNGDVAQFRQTLAGLSEQLEIDRLAFLHKKVESHGANLPTLNEIASDISGEKIINHLGDCDLYSQRPKARLEGWVSGLSFGISKRAKKFSK